MLEKIVDLSIKQRILVIIATIVMAVIGVFNFYALPIDAVPDITNVQVQINAEAEGFTPLEVEQRITFPLEKAISGLPNLSYIRSLSKYGLSQVTAIFEDGTDIYFARQLVSNRIQEVKEQLPLGVDPIMGPIATGLSEIFMWTVKTTTESAKNAYSLMDLRTFQDWIIKPQLLTVPGVTEVNSAGGYVKQYQVAPKVGKLFEYGISLQEIIAALSQNNSNAGAGYIEHNGAQYLIRTQGQVSDLSDIENIVVGTRSGIPIYIKNVADVKLGKELRTGAATQNGEEVILGTVFMLMGENSRAVSLKVSEKIKEINKALPEGVEAQPVYDRTNLVNATLKTVRNNLLEGAILVIVVLFLLLGNFKAALIASLVIPLSMLFAVTGMVKNQVSGNLLSLGALDFGIIVDGTVIIVENCIRRLAEEQKRLGRLLLSDERYALIKEASKEVFSPSIFGIFIIMIVYLPILTLSGVEGKMFQPMAFTVLAALTGAMILSITFIPAMIAQFLSNQEAEKENLFIAKITKIYSTYLNRALNNRPPVIAFISVMIALSFIISTRMGGEFLPTLNERDIAVHALRVTGTSLSQAIRMQDVLEKKIKELPEVETVFSKIGTPDIATDPMPPSVADVFIIVKPRSQWANPKLKKSEFIRRLEEKLAQVPGNKYEITQPIEMRFNELIAGVRSDIAVKVFGEDMNILLSKANEIEPILSSIQGASDVRVEQVDGLPVFSIELDRKKMARLGLNVADVQEVVQIALGGKKAGQVFIGDRRFDLVVRLSENSRKDPELLKRIPIPLSIKHTQTADHMLMKQGNTTNLGYITLGSVAKFISTKGPNQINRENGKRRVVITANVRNRDLGSFVKEAQSAIDEKISLPVGYWISWGGQFENLISASKRLWIVGPISLLIIFILLYAAFGSVKNALLVFSGIPLALTGGIVFLWLRGIPLSISAAVGFIALSGVAVLNGLVLVSFFSALREQGITLDDAIRQGATTRLRPILMTALVASLGFIPMAFATGMGAEVQRPLATVVIGGIISSTALSLFALPVLYRMAHFRKSEIS
jgi:heavy metal efflux system protein